MVGVLSTVVGYWGSGEGTEDCVVGVLAGISFGTWT